MPLGQRGRAQSKRTLVLATQHQKLFAKERLISRASGEGLVILAGGLLRDLLQSKHRTQGTLMRAFLRFRERCREEEGDREGSAGDGAGSTGLYHRCTASAWLKTGRAVFPRVCGPRWALEVTFQSLSGSGSEPGRDLGPFTVSSERGTLF